MQETAVYPHGPRPKAQYLIASAAIVHAALITGNWWVALYADLRLIPGWLLLAWAWLVWPLILLFTPVKVSRLAIGAVAIGAAVLAPSIPIIYTFTVWSIGGFAP